MPERHADWLRQGKRGVAQSSSVKIQWLDSRSVVDQLRTIALRMKRRHSEIEEVLLFGSLARGEAVPGSDADLLVVLSSSDRPFIERIPCYLPVEAPLGIDVFPYTREELERMLEEGNPLVTRAVDEGVTLA